MQDTFPDRTGVLIIGGGVAGLGLALRLADRGRQCTVLAKEALTEGASLYAQGGIAAVLDASDSFEAHVADTITAGAGLCHPDTVRLVVNEAPAAIEWLRQRGVSFSEDNESSTGFHLTREGGHSERRVIHAADTTGREVETTLEQIVRDHPNIRILEYFIAVDLITTRKLGQSGPNRCVGVYAYDKKLHRVTTLQADTVALATGGTAKVYLYTSNPDTSTGDGIAMAWRAGCRVANMEFVQFHPTCLYHPLAKSFLISEALRGEGARLMLENGDRFMARHDERGELAPRDIVARAIDFEMKKHGADSVFLDISHKDADETRAHFPN
ncbi:MAG: FAD-dependent oxidoreductase, partial [Proteobacteria bacterium]